MQAGLRRVEERSSAPVCDLRRPIAGLSGAFFRAISAPRAQAIPGREQPVPETLVLPVCRLTLRRDAERWPLGAEGNGS